MKPNRKVAIHEFKTINRGVLPPIVAMLTNEPLHGDIFWHNGAKYIRGGQRFNGKLFEVELTNIVGFTGMHIHEYYHGVCRICGVLSSHWR